MRVLVNGAAFELAAAPGANLGDVLSEADELLDKAGSVIIGIRIDGAEVDADNYPSFSSRSLDGIDTVEIHAENASSMKAKALETLLELVALSTQAAKSASESTTAQDWSALRKGATDLRDAFAGLFAADELSLAQAFADTLAKSGDDPSFEVRSEISAQAARLDPIFSERLAELRAPVQEMRSAAELFASRSGALGDLPVLLHTGKEDQAMREVLFFIEIFNKVIRLIPELRKSGVDTASLMVGDSSLADFYTDFNRVLRELTDAFEHKDAVLIGDLAEYEVLPRMTKFFTAMREALPGK
ncbi:MAG: hypothetical protein Q8M76_17685 [Spirochaetaceae bacterium]|nr:hypothetical protein [Spirochaetaceae bacterium]